MGEQTSSFGVVGIREAVGHLPQRGADDWQFTQAQRTQVTRTYPIVEDR